MAGRVAKILGGDLVAAAALMRALDDDLPGAPVIPTMNARPPCG